MHHRRCNARRRRHHTRMHLRRYAIRARGGNATIATKDHLNKWCRPQEPRLSRSRIDWITASEKRAIIADAIGKCENLRKKLFSFLFRLFLPRHTKIILHHYFQIIIKYIYIYVVKFSLSFFSFFNYFHIYMYNFSSIYLWILRCSPNFRCTMEFSFSFYFN